MERAKVSLKSHLKTYGLWFQQFKKICFKPFCEKRREYLEKPKKFKCNSINSLSPLFIVRRVAYLWVMNNVCNGMLQIVLSCQATRKPLQTEQTKQSLKKTVTKKRYIKESKIKDTLNTHTHITHQFTAKQSPFSNKAALDFLFSHF